MTEWLETESYLTDKKQKIKYRVDIDAREFKGRAGMPWLIMAANVNLSINDLLDVMAHYGYERTRSWVSRRRWISLTQTMYVNWVGKLTRTDSKPPLTGSWTSTRTFQLEKWSVFLARRESGAARIGCSNIGCIRLPVCRCPI